MFVKCSVKTERTKKLYQCFFLALYSFYVFSWTFKKKCFWPSHEACGSLAPGSQTDLCSLHWKAESQPLDHRVSPSPWTFLLRVSSSNIQSSWGKSLECFLISHLLFLPRFKWGLPRYLTCKESACQRRRLQLSHCTGKIPWSR